MRITTPFILLVFLLGCAHDPLVDIRGQAVGAYTYKLKFYSPDGNSLNYYGSNFDEFGTFVVGVDPDDESMLTVAEGSHVLFRATRITKNTNGFSFEIPTWDWHQANGDVFVMEGFPAFELGGIQAHGNFDPVTQKLTGWEKSIQPNGIVVMEYVGTKVN